MPLVTGEGQWSFWRLPTGKILAEVSRPDFDPNTLSQNWDILVNDENDSSLLNRATNGAYPPGSTFKIVTALDYFRTKGTFEGYSYLCQGSITVGRPYAFSVIMAMYMDRKIFTVHLQIPVIVLLQISGISLGGSSIRNTAEDLLFNKALPLNSYRKTQFYPGWKVWHFYSDADRHRPGRNTGFPYAYGTDHSCSG